MFLLEPQEIEEIFAAKKLETWSNVEGRQAIAKAQARKIFEMLGGPEINSNGLVIEIKFSLPFDKWEQFKREVSEYYPLKASVVRFLALQRHGE